MEFLNRLYECPRCQAVICGNEGVDEDITCPECGLTRCIEISDIKEHLKFKARPNGTTGKWELEITIKDALYRDTGERRQVKMIVDRGHDDYEKTVIAAASGQMRYHKREPLSEHIGRGSVKAKKTRKKTSR